MEERLQGEFKQTTKQMRKIMKSAMKMRGELKRKMDELSAAREAGKIKIDSDEGAYWNVALTNFIEKTLQQMEGEKLQFAEAEVLNEEQPKAQKAQEQKQPQLDESLEAKWGRVMAQFRPMVDVKDWRVYFDHSSSIHAVSFSDGKLRLYAPNERYINEVEDRYADVLGSLIRREFGNDVFIEYTTKEK